MNLSSLSEKKFKVNELNELEYEVRIIWLIKKQTINQIIK